MIIKRPEPWGQIEYDTVEHRFRVRLCDRSVADYTYASSPVVLNVDLTMRCNMTCRHCVTKDFPVKEDLVVSTELLDWINWSPFMVIVITGGEPFLAEYEENLMTLIEGTREKGLMVDTNGTIYPSRPVVETLVKTDTLVRVSWDSPRLHDELFFRHMKRNLPINMPENDEWYVRKIENIRRLHSDGVKVAVQSVIHSRNRDSIKRLPAKLEEFHIHRWYLQRFIPSHRARNPTWALPEDKSSEVIGILKRECGRRDIECVFKSDRRHNSVILLVGDGKLYTQGEQAGEKIPLGTIRSHVDWYLHVSPADHAHRYYIV